MPFYRASRTDLRLLLLFHLNLASKKQLDLCMALAMLSEARAHYNRNVKCSVVRLKLVSALGLTTATISIDRLQGASRNVQQQSQQTPPFTYPTRCRCTQHLLASSCFHSPYTTTKSCSQVSSSTRSTSSDNVRNTSVRFKFISLSRA